VDGKNEPNFMPNNYNFCLVKNENYVEEWKGINFIGFHC
jgi:hypothetical protein